MKDDRRALVLAGGGITGIAWELGMIAGLAELGVDLSGADLVIGTSAGSVAGAQLRSGTPIERLYAGQLEAAEGELSATLPKASLLRWALLGLAPGNEEKARQRIGRAALAKKTVPESDRREVIESRLTDRSWPRRPFKVTAVDASSGEFVVFDNESGVPLVDAVGASCAVPMVWPPVTIRGRRYIDGGVRSSVNADLAQGYGRVVVLAPFTASLRRSGRVGPQLERLGPHVHTAVVTPDANTRRAMGSNALDPAFRSDAAKAGRSQARLVRDTVAVAWGEPPH
ncbi:patatin-like phospholipase family protein [Kineosporia sp. J2-2]|uniref:Patatin-like phospholipase family protein n=1 Tax=Kineosporia corallincola TaxID=2835133 RepID=A0ABS5TJN8_9ACTN|nr:patatin-like phospholipase family protein [Kineosporia corallincola]MBT0771307.1 patatin-like phospholipase family protein [Kineosporia corallincola]